MFIETFFIHQFSLDFAQKFNFSEEIDHSKVMSFIQKVIPISGSLYSNRLEIKIMKKFKLSTQNAKNIIRNLIEKEIIIKNPLNNISINLLANMNRKIIYELIKKNPGSFVNQLQKVSNMSPCQVLYHIGVLLQFKLIQQITLNKIKIFGVIEEIRENILIGFILMKKKNQEIIAHLYSKPTGATLHECDLNLSHIPKSTINYILQKLVQIKLISVILHNDKKVYIINKLHKNHLQSHLKNPISV